MRHPSACELSAVRAAFLDQLAPVGGGEVFDEDGFVYTDRRAIARHAFLTAEQVATAYPDGTWSEGEVRDPAIGPVRAFIGFDWLIDHREEMRAAMRTWSYAAAGYLVVTRSGRRYDAIRRITFPLWHALETGGFDDGDVFLRDNERYLSRVRALWPRRCAAPEYRRSRSIMARTTIRCASRCAAGSRLQRRRACRRG